MIDLNERRLNLKQKESCKHYVLNVTTTAGGGSYRVEKLPNIADIFELWPYIMYYNETKNA